MTKVDDFLLQLKVCTDTSVFKDKKLDKLLIDYLCTGCGLGVECKKDENPNERHICNNCEQCKARNYTDCTNLILDNPQCKECFNCGCQKCNLNDYFYYDIGDDTPNDEYLRRERENINKLMDTLNNAHLSLDEWMPFISKDCIMKYLPWVKYKKYWELYIVSKDTPINCPNIIKYWEISDEDKQYFIKPQVPSIYNIMRIMSGMGGIKYDDDIIN